MDWGHTRRRPAALAALPLLLALSLIAGLLLGPSPGRAQVSTSLGVDLVSDGNTGAFAGSVQSCVEVDVGVLFPVDIYIKDAVDLRAWELRFAFDPELLSLVGHDFEHFLLSTSPRGTIFPSLFEVERAGRYFVAATEFRGTPDSGSGVLVRLTMQAMAPGRSPAMIVTEPRYFAPRLTDANGDAPFEDQVSQGEVAVGVPCTSSDPEPAPPPTSGSGSMATDDDGGLIAPPALVALSDSPPRAPSGERSVQTSEASVASEGITEDQVGERLSPGVEGTSEALGAAQPPDAPGEDDAPDQGRTAPPEGGSSGFAWPRSTILAITAIAIVAGGGLMALNLRRRW